MKKRRLIALMLVAAMALTAFTSCLDNSSDEDDAVETGTVSTGVVEDAANDNATDASQNNSNNSQSEIKPYVQIIGVKDESFVGFNDLQREDNGEYTDYECKTAVDMLCVNKFITGRINPYDDEKGKFNSEAVATRAEVISMFVNAFSKDKIKSDNWYDNIIDRVEKDNFPKDFVALISGDDKKLSKEDLQSTIRYDEMMILMIFCYENYTGNKMSPAHGSNLSELSLKDVQKYVNSILPEGDRAHISNRGVSPRRGSVAMYLYNLITETKTINYWDGK